MKCKLCGYQTARIERMASHYRREHPGHMRRRKFKPTYQKGESRSEELKSRYAYCPHCGARLA